MSIDTTNLRLLRALKPLRIIKLFKAFKLLRALKEELAIVFGLTFVKTIVLFAYLIYSVHFCSCGYWRVKVETNHVDEIASFLEARGANVQVPFHVYAHFIIAKSYAVIYFRALERRM